MKYGLFINPVVEMTIQVSLETHVQSFHVDSENLKKDLKLSTEATGAKRLTTSVESSQIS